MGNVHASSPSFTSSMPMSPPPPSPGGEVPLEDQKESPKLIDPFPNNPGTMEELHKKCKEVFPAIFEGGRFMLNKPLSSHFQVSHTIHFSNTQPSEYKFGATYVGMKQTGPAEAFPVLVAEMSPSGDLNANIIHQFSPFVRSKCVAQIQSNKWQATQMTTDWRGKNFTASLTLGNMDIVNGSGVAVAHYLQKVSPRLDLGAEVAYQYGMQVPGGHIAVHSVAARFNGEKCVASGTVGGAGVHLCYYQKASDTMQLGVELESNLRMQECTASMAYQLEIPKANFTFRGTLNTNWIVGAVLEKKLMPLPFTLALSANYHHVKDKFKLGCGFIIG